jgi:uncharacterized membrane protein YciS (DUF1049 family)
MATDAAPNQNPAAGGKQIEESNTKSFLTRSLTTVEKEKLADVVIYLGVIAPAIFLALDGNLEVFRVIGANTGVPRATLIVSLIEADGVLGAFLAAMFVIRYELTKMWREEERKQAEEAVAERHRVEARVR